MREAQLPHWIQGLLYLSVRVLLDPARFELERLLIVKFKGETLDTILPFRYQICTSDDECQASQVCDGNIKVCRGLSNNSNPDFCSGHPNWLCKEGEGDCDHDDECEGALVCGDSCPIGHHQCCTTGKFPSYFQRNINAVTSTSASTTSSTISPLPSTTTATTVTLPGMIPCHFLHLGS